jgi:hypothetical protein
MRKERERERSARPAGRRAEVANRRSQSGSSPCPHACIVCSLPDKACVVPAVVALRVPAGRDDGQVLALPVVPLNQPTATTANNRDVADLLSPAVATTLARSLSLEWTTTTPVDEGPGGGE